MYLYQDELQFVLLVEGRSLEICSAATLQHFQHINEHLIHTNDF